MDKSANIALATFSAIFVFFGLTIVGVLAYYTERIENRVSRTSAEIAKIEQMFQ